MLDLEHLNDEQKKAVMQAPGPLLVLAGPGSGKTFTITQRIFYLIEREHVSPENILVITFTKDAALSMQNRFRELSKRTLPVNFGTFHSIFYHILKESHMISTETILTDSQKRNLLFPIIKSYAEKNDSLSEDFREEADVLLQAIGYYKNTKEFESAKNRLTERWKPYFAEIVEDYEHTKEKNRFIDFDDMIMKCLRLLEQNQAVRRYWQDRFTHILIDEFQDINPVQYEVVRLLSAPPYHLFAVGDDDQSIYGFRGSKPSCLKKFEADYPTRKICLEVNYRSKMEIIQASLAVIGENKERFEKKLRAVDSSSDGKKQQAVTLKAFEDKTKQNQYLLEKIRETINENKKAEGMGKRIGILFRTNSYMLSFAAVLNREGIPFHMKERPASIYEHFVVKDIMAYLLISQGKGSRAQFLQIMNRPSRYISREALREGEPNILNVLRFYSDSPGRKDYKDRIVDGLRRWEMQMKRVSEMPLHLAVNYIRKVVGYEAYLRERAEHNQERMLEWEELLDWLKEDASHYHNLTEWISAQKYDAETRKDAGIKKNTEIKEGSISLMTVHASKGLEFDKVYIPDCNEKIFPHGTMSEQGVCEEERRLFYVAMTRAKENLELLYLTGTKERPRLPSRFLNPLFEMYNYSSTISSNSQLSRYSSKASATFSYSSSSEIKSSSGSSLGSSGFS